MKNVFYQKIIINISDTNKLREVEILDLKSIFFLNFMLIRSVFLKYNCQNKNEN